MSAIRHVLSVCGVGWERVQGWHGQKSRITRRSGSMVRQVVPKLDNLGVLVSVSTTPESAATSSPTLDDSCQLT
jgi:hypothetical protein